MEEDLVAELGVNTRELVEKIWAEVAADHGVRARSSLEPLPTFPSLTHDEERRYLNDHWRFDRVPSQVQSSGLLPGLKRQAKRRAGRFVIRVLDRYFDEDQEFRAHLVRLQNKLTDEHDRTRTEIREVYQTFSKEIDRLWQAYASMHTALEERVAALEAAGATASRGPAAT